MTLRSIGWWAMALALMGVVAFPWLFTRALMVGIALGYPPAAIFIGAVVDLVYYPGYGVPMGLAWGVGIAAVAYGVRSFVRGRMLLP
jgi:hypothetical protein